MLKIRYFELETILLEGITCISYIMKMVGGDSFWRASFQRTIAGLKGEGYVFMRFWAVRKVASQRQ